MANIFDLFRKIESEREASVPGHVTAIIAGLGNPEPKYTFTRHNAGFLAIDYAAPRLSADIRKAKYHSLVGEAVIGGERVLLMKPQTYMNRSGLAIREAADFYKIPPERVFVLCDDVSLPVGVVRIRAKGSAGGHNGLKSIIEELRSDSFPRIKLGVGEKPSPEWDLADWVLGTLDEEERKLMVSAFKRAYEALPLMLCGDISTAQSKYNG